MKHKTLIVPRGAAVVKVLLRAMRNGRTPWNYMITWKDTQGTGIQLAVVDWLPKGQIYVK